MPSLNEEVLTEDTRQKARRFTGSAPDDAAALSEYIDLGEGALTELPPRSLRTPAEAAQAERILREARTARFVFMGRHAEWVYDQVTSGRTLRKRVYELAYDAADLVRGLVPTRSQMQRETTSDQRDKDGREIDQGIFFWGVLRIASTGEHLLQSMLLPTERAKALLPEFRASGVIMLDSVEVRRVGVAAHVTMLNDACLNAEDNQLISDLEVAIDLALLDEDVSVGILRGGAMKHPRYRGQRVFTAGINLKHLASGRISFLEFLLQRELGYVNKILRGLWIDEASCNWDYRALEMPWIAAVDSFAIGGGMQLLLVFDKVIAASDSYMSLPAAKEGMIPGAANFRLPRICGSRLSRQVILSGRKIVATDPDARFIIDDVVDPDQMDAQIEKRIEELSAPAVVANRHALNISEEPLDSFRIYMAEFALDEVRRLYSTDVMDKAERAFS